MYHQKPVLVPVLVTTIESESESLGCKIRAAKLRLCFSAPENTVQYWWSCSQCAQRILTTVFYEILREKYMQDACCSADCFQFVIRNLKNPQTALWVPGIQQNELQLLGTGIREFLTTSNTGPYLSGLRPVCSTTYYT